MMTVLTRYFSVTLVAAILAPFWLSVFFDDMSTSTITLTDAVIWSILPVVALWLSKTPAFQVRGRWRTPKYGEAKLYGVIFLAVLAVDYGSKLLFFRHDRTERIEIFPDFGLQSVFHQSELGSTHFYISLLAVLVFVIGALFFRLSVAFLDRTWLISAAFSAGGIFALFVEVLLFGGIHDSFYFSGPLIWLCPNCALKYSGAYIWTPADFFVNAAALPLVVFIASYLWPAREIRQIHEE